jgi:hypothetical protein
LNSGNEDQTYQILEKALQNQEEEEKIRIKNLNLPSVTAYPKLTTGDNFIRWKRHFESVCYANVELLNLLEDGPLVNPIDPPEQENILYQGPNGISLFYKSESIYRSVDLYCRKINYHIWQALLDAIKDDVTAFGFAHSVHSHDYSALSLKLCSRWLATAETRKAKHLDELNKLQRNTNEQFKVFYHRLETIINILQIEFDYQVPEDQIILKVLHSVDDNLQSLFLHLRSSSIPIAEISQKLIIAEEQLSITKKPSYAAANSTTLQKRVRTCWICGSTEHLKKQCPNNVEVQISTDLNNHFNSSNPNFRYSNSRGRSSNSSNNRNTTFAIPTSENQRGRGFVHRGRVTNFRGRGRGNPRNRPNSTSNSRSLVVNHNANNAEITESFDDETIYCSICGGNHYSTSCPTLSVNNVELTSTSANINNMSTDENNELPLSWQLNMTIVSTSQQVIPVNSTFPFFVNSISNCNERINIIISDSGASRCMFRTDRTFPTIVTIITYWFS